MSTKETNPMTRKTRAQERIDDLDVSPTALLAQMEELRAEVDADDLAHVLYDSWFARVSGSIVVSLSAAATATSDGRITRSRSR